MPRFECKKCGSLVVVEKDAKTAICQICGKKQHVPANAMDDQVPVTRNNFDPQRDHYEQLLYKAEKYRDIQILTKTAEEFDKLGDYENSKEMAAYCRRRIEEEKVKRTQEADKRNIKEARNQKGQKRSHIKLAIINGIILASIVGITILSNKLLKDPIYYQGIEYMNQGMYSEAESAFRRLNGYRDSREKIEEIDQARLDERYNNAIAHMEKGNYLYAGTEFSDLDGYKDSETYALECKYRQALAYMEQHQYGTAWERFSALGDYKDAAELAEQAKEKLTNPQ